MYYLLFAFYFAIGCFVINRINFIKRAGIGTRTILLLFSLKIAAGILIGWMSQKFYPQGSDYWGLNDAGWREYKLLTTDPIQFFTEIFRSSYDNYGGVFDSVNSYWNDLKNTLIGKMLAFCNIFSRGNYYINSLFFNFIGFFGHVALYRVFADIFRNKKWPVITGCFLLPSALYFSSGIHKDLVVFTLLGFFCYALYFSLKDRFKPLYIITILISFIGLVLIRNFVAVALIPATTAWLISRKTTLKPVIIFISTYILMFLGCWFIQLLDPGIKPLEVVSDKQRAFIELPVASSQLELAVLEPTVKSFTKNFPQAVNHSFFRPYLWERPTNFLIPLAIELFLYQLLFVIWIFRRTNTNYNVTGFISFALFLSVSLLLFIGYIVPNTGSIVRYRSLYLPFLLTPLLCTIRMKKYIKI